MSTSQSVSMDTQDEDSNSLNSMSVLERRRRNIARNQSYLQNLFTEGSEKEKSQENDANEQRIEDGLEEEKDVDECLGRLSDEACAALAKQFIGREEEIQHVASYLNLLQELPPPPSMVPPSLVANGPPDTGKTSLVTSALAIAKWPTVVIDCAVLTSFRELLTTIQARLVLASRSVWKPAHLAPNPSLSALIAASHPDSIDDDAFLGIGANRWTKRDRETAWGPCNTVSQLAETFRALLPPPQIHATVSAAVNYSVSSSDASLPSLVPISHSRQQIANTPQNEAVAASTYGSISHSMKSNKTLKREGRIAGIAFILKNLSPRVMTEREAQQLLLLSSLAIRRVVFIFIQRQWQLLGGPAARHYVISFPSYSSQTIHELVRRRIRCLVIELGMSTQLIESADSLPALKDTINIQADNLVSNERLLRSVLDRFDTLSIVALPQVTAVMTALETIFNTLLALWFRLSCVPLPHILQTISLMTADKVQNISSEEVASAQQTIMDSLHFAAVTGLVRSALEQILSVPVLSAISAPPTKTKVGSKPLSAVALKTRAILRERSQFSVAAWPVRMRYLLIAAYLAARNPKATDNIKFVSDGSKRRRTEAIRQISNTNEGGNTEITGGASISSSAGAAATAAFSIERLLSIYAQVAKTCGLRGGTSLDYGSAFLQSMLLSLQHYKFVYQAQGYRLMRPMYHAVVPKSLVEEISESVSFPLNDFLVNATRQQL